MPAETGNVGVLSKELLDARAAARHLGILPEVFNAWVPAGLLSGPSIDGQFWTAVELDRAIEQLERSGFRYVPNKKSTEYVPLPNVHRTFRILTDGTKSWHHKRRDIRGPIYGEPNSPRFMKGLIHKERQFATSHPDPAEQSHNQYPPVAQQSTETSSPAPKLVTQTAPVSGAQPASPPTAEEVLQKLALPSPSLAPVHFFTEREVAAMFRVTLRTFREQTHGKGFHLQLGRRRLYAADDIQRLAEVLRCRSNSSLPAPAGPRTGAFAARTTASTLTEALKLATESSRSASSKNGSGKSKKVFFSDPQNQRSRQPQLST